MNGRESKKILIAQIGRGNYQVCEYAEYLEETESHKGTSLQAGYSFEAVYQQFSRDVQLETGRVSHLEECQPVSSVQWADETDRSKNQDIILLTGTESSYWGSLCAYFLNRASSKLEESLVITDKTCEVLYQKLKEIAERKGRKEFPGMDQVLKIQKSSDKNQFPKIKEDGSQEWHEKINGISFCDMHREASLIEAFLNQYAEMLAEFHILILKEGISDRQLQNNFEVLKKSIESFLDQEAMGAEPEEKVHLCFDISMGYRSIPMYIYTFANYMTRLRPETFDLHVYYGMADAKQGKWPNQWCPLVNLRQIDDLMQWINVINEFRSLGSVKGLKQLFSQHPDWDIEIDSEKHVQLSEAFILFDYATNANNLISIEEGIRRIADLNISREAYPHFPNEARVLLEGIASDFKRRFYSNKVEGCPYGYLTLRLAEWFLEQERIGNASIALQEGITTYILERYPDYVGMKSDIDIFDYEKRKHLNECVFSKLNDAGDAIFQEYTEIRRNIRNVYSHILLGNKNLTREEVNQNIGRLRHLMEYMIEELEPDVTHADGETCLKERLYGYVLQEDVKYYLKNMAEKLNGKPNRKGKGESDPIQLKQTALQKVEANAVWRQQFESEIRELCRIERNLSKNQMPEPDTIGRMLWELMEKKQQADEESVAKNPNVKIYAGKENIEKKRKIYSVKKLVNFYIDESQLFLDMVNQFC